MYHPDGDFDNWGGYEWEGSGIICEISVPSAQFCCEPKMSLKKSLLKISKNNHYRFSQIELV